jgi:hypothetical protein
MCSEEKPVTWPMIIGKAQSCDEVTVPDKVTFSESNNKQLLVYTLVSMGTVLIIWNIGSLAPVQS